MKHAVRTAAVSGLLACSASFSRAASVVIINAGAANECYLSPTEPVFVLDSQGNVLMNGSLTGPGCGGAAVPGTFAPQNPAPANLTVTPNSLSSSGGAVTPNFVVYNATSCSGFVGVSTGCAKVPAPWGNGGQICTGTTNAAGQTYCANAAAPVNVPANSGFGICTYTFQAVNCTNGSAAINSQISTVTVPPAPGG